MSILHDKKEWTVRQRSVATIDHWDNAYSFEWVKGNVFLTRDKTGLRYLELNPDGTIGRDRYLDKQSATNLADVRETTSPVYSPDGRRGFLYQKKESAFIYMFDDLDHPISIPRNLSRAKLWVLDEAGKSLMSVFDREISLYDLKGVAVYDKNGQPLKLNIDAPKGDRVQVEHIGYRDGKLYYAFQVDFHHNEIVSARVSTEKQTTFGTAALTQNYEYYMAYTVANNSISWADIVGDQLHIYCNMLYGDHTAMEIGVMELDPLR